MYLSVKYTLYSRKILYAVEKVMFKEIIESYVHYFWGVFKDLRFQWEPKGLAKAGKGTYW